MFKKVLVVLVAVFAIFALTACKKERTYKADGVYLAFKESLNYGAPQVTTVSVTIKDDKIESFYIDCVQSVKGASGYVFNEKSKKELQYLYGMHNSDDEDNDYVRQDLSTTEGMNAYKAYLQETGKKEWFEQAVLIEAYFKSNGTTLTKNDKGTITNITGVTVSDSDYSALAAEAVQNAKDGKVVRVTQYADGATCNVVWVEGTINEAGKVTGIVIDTLQGKYVDNAFTWNQKSKQELQYLYAMHNKNDAENDYVKQDLSTTEGLNAYKAYLQETGKKEWFEQANTLAAFVLANGLTNVKVGSDGKLTNKPEGLASVSVTASHYVELLEELLDDFSR